MSLVLVGFAFLQPILVFVIVVGFVSGGEGECFQEVALAGAVGTLFPGFFCLMLLSGSEDVVGLDHEARQFSFVLLA